MPFLRRRGNMASESDMRRQTGSSKPSTPDGQPQPSTQAPSQSPEDPDPTSSPDGARESTTSRPDTLPAQENPNRHKRFSIMRFRNASDSQLSIKAKQQAEDAPPLPKRAFLLHISTHHDVISTDFLCSSSHHYHSSDK